MKKSIVLFLFIVGFASAGKSQTVSGQYKDLVDKINTKAQDKGPAARLIEFAKTMIGVPYRYASSNPSIGFDCSGFVSYVFRNFGFATPRSSSEFNDAGTPVKLENAKVGDILVFTGTNVRKRIAGHVGIIAKIDGDTIQFIHSTSGKTHGVTVTTLNAYYKSRFMKAVSLF
jgi:lipoprotein Spr